MLEMFEAYMSVVMVSMSDFFYFLSLAVKMEEDNLGSELIRSMVYIGFVVHDIGSSWYP